jgi:hypothetical protein
MADAAAAHERAARGNRGQRYDSLHAALAGRGFLLQAARATLEDLFETLPALSGPYPLREPVPRGMQGTHARGRRGTGTAPTVVDSRLLASSSTHH